MATDHEISQRILGKINNRVRMFDYELEEKINLALETLIEELLKELRPNH